jgi:hypothetical protein
MKQVEQAALIFKEEWGATSFGRNLVLSYSE